MNWLKNFVRPKIRALVGRKEVPDNLWQTCPKCESMLYHRELAKNYQVCHHCGHHFRLSAKGRLDLLFDDGAYTRVELPEAPIDPLKFRDRKRYTDRLKEAQAKTGEADAVAVAHGAIGGEAAVVAAFEFGFLGGSMGLCAGEAIVTAAQLARYMEAPLIVVPSSGGARMQEGAFSLMQLPRTIVAIEDVREAGLPYIVVLADPTTGGVSASFAMLGDIHIAEPGATIGFAGVRVIQSTIRESLPEGFQSAEYMLEHGMVDMVVPRAELKATLARIIGLLRRRGPTAEIVPFEAGDEGEAMPAHLPAASTKPPPHAEAADD